MVSLPLCLHRACPCSTLADTHWVQIQTQHTQIRKWVGVRRYVMTKIEELEGGDCVCLFKLVRPHIAGSLYQSPHTRLFEKICLNFSQEALEPFGNNVVHHRIVRIEPTLYKTTTILSCYLSSVCFQNVTELVPFVTSAMYLISGSTIVLRLISR